MKSKVKTRVALLATVILVAALSGGWYWLGMHSLARNFQKLDWQRLEDMSEAALGSATKVGEPDQSRQVAPARQGAIPYYREHPDELERDKRCLQTYRAALEIAGAARAREQSVEHWTPSTEIDWIPPSGKTDGWGHSFCVRSSPQRTALVSPGWQAVGSLDCGPLDITEEELDKMAPARLNVQASGALVFVLPAKGRVGH